jgi:hypothetical protein
MMNYIKIAVIIIELQMAGDDHSMMIEEPQLEESCN